MALEEDWWSFSWVKLNKGANPTKNSDEFYNLQELITHLSSINTCRISGVGGGRRWSSSSWTWRKDGIPDPWLSRTRRIWNSSWKTGPQHAGMSTTPLTRLCSNTVFVQAWYRVAWWWSPTIGTGCGSWIIHFEAGLSIGYRILLLQISLFLRLLLQSVSDVSDIPRMNAIFNDPGTLA